MTPLYSLRTDGDQADVRDLIKRLSAKTSILDSGCYHWNGCKSVDNYGLISYQNKQWRINRLIYTIHNGPITDSKLVCHSCDNPSCWYHEHLWLGDHQDNTQDMWAKGRESKRKRGRKIGESSKLTADEVIEIRKLLEEGILTQSEIGHKFFVTGVMVSRIKLGKAWAWL